jgi:FMNH2-dependent dimethyl sulfone monooxygenase
VSLEDYSVSNRGLRTGLVGTPEQISARLDELERIGIDLTLLQFSPQAEEMERFAAEVIAKRGALSHGAERRIPDGERVLIT